MPLLPLRRLLCPTLFALSAFTTLSTLPAQAQTPGNDNDKDSASATWDLTELYPTVAAWDAERQRLLQDFDSLAQFRGTLGVSGEQLHTALQRVSDLYRDAVRVYVYTSLQQDEDLRVTAAQERAQLAEALLAKFSQATAWIDPEIVAVGEVRIRQFIADTPTLAPFRHRLDDTLRQASHTLGSEAEQALSYFAQSLDAPGNLYSIIANSDIPFPTLTLANGESVRLDSQGYERLRSSPDRDLRKQVFDTFWNKWLEYRNSIGMVLNSHLQAQVAQTRAHKYQSMLERELFAYNLPPAVYQTLVTEVNNSLPTLQRYFTLRARMLGVEQLHYYDIYPPLVSLDRQFDLDTSKAITLDAMGILGQDWVARQRAAMDQRWMHVYPQQGKRSGAYMQGGAYDVHPYLLLNHNNDYASLSTLAHEWGHAMHTLYAKDAQPFETADYATFIAEIPSTSLELILLEYMKEHAQTKNEKLFYLGSALENLRGTFFRQTMFAEFELQLYQAAERGEALSGERISQLYLALLKHYHGSDAGVVQIDDLYANEWMFVPHFYYNMYVYQYATSLTAGTALYEKIVQEGAAGVENFKNLLRAGGSDYPYELLRNAGVDLATPAPYQAVVRRMNAIMDEMEALLATPFDGNVSTPTPTSAARGSASCANVSDFSQSAYFLDGAGLGSEGFENYPDDLKCFTENAALCEHFAGEEPYDAQRQAEITSALEKYCRAAQALSVTLKQKYAGDAAISKTLTACDAGVLTVCSDFK
ncbi:MAG: oligoendopeptidase F [Pseudomonadales bacterium]|jgi:oligoendopeptidase F|nr:oligoendopeptidase F [Pseudomonadales bacterium]